MERANKVLTRHDEPDRTRDCLADYRTILANERTFLAYIRTILVLAGGGVSLIKLFDHDVIVQAVGWLLLFMATALFIIAVVRFRRMKGLIRSQVESDGSTGAP